MKPRSCVPLAVIGFTSALAQSAIAQSATDERAVSGSVSTSDAEVDNAELGDDPFEIGIFGGAVMMSEREVPDTQFDDFGAEAGLRLGLYPIRYFGVEGEGAAIFIGREGTDRVILGTGRLHAVGQLPLGVVAPFILAGGGITGGECRAEGCSGTFSGREIDGGFHFGVGVKFGLPRHLQARLDLRDNIVSGNDHVPEALVGLAVTFGGPEEVIVEEPLDSDGDGMVDQMDYCPMEAAPTKDGCPVRDRDGDGKEDEVDECPDVASELPSGCPDQDPDKDGIPIEADKCPTVAGIGPDGCPDPDPDKDGISGENDRCPNEAEVPNGFEDKDGCPDQMPDKVAEFTGTVQGIYFELGKAKIRQTSFPVLDRAVAVLQEYPDIRMRIAGYTDSTGEPEANVELSKARAQAVADYMIGKGVDSSRLETVGYGEENPVADNATREGREQNRRIEFEVLK